MINLHSEHTLAIVNPAAGDGAGARVGRDLAHELEGSGFKLEIIQTPAPGEAARIAREASADGVRTVIAVGGDGTANEIANGLVDTSTAMALYPIGSIWLPVAHPSYTVALVALGIWTIPGALTWLAWRVPARLE